MSKDIFSRNGNFLGTVTPIDAIPTENSQNSVRSGGVYDATEIDKSITETVTNLIDKSKVVAGTINNTTGDINPSSSYHVTDFIEVDTSEVYLSPKCDRMGAYSESKQFISTVNVVADATYGSGAVNFPSGTKYVRLRIIENGVDDAIFVQAKFYNKNAARQIVCTGFSEKFLSAFPYGYAQYASIDENFARGNNLFDYKNDLAQATAGLTTGLSPATGEFQYKYNIIANDSEISGDFTVSLDKYFPLTYGQMIFANKWISVIAYYDANKQCIRSYYAYQKPFVCGVAPEGCAYARVSFIGHPTTDGMMHSLSEIKDIAVWVMPSIGGNVYTPERKYKQPYLQIDGASISPNYFDKVIPSMNESQFLSAMRCMAIREVNRRDHAWRFGNFNMWIMESTKGWNMTKKMLMDYGVDFCGFEECVTAMSSDHCGIAEFLHGWQFPSGFYTNWTDGESTQIDKSFVSRFSVTESTKLFFPSATSNTSYLNCKISLPRYMDVRNPFRVLSCYIVHFPIAQNTEKIAVANDLLQQIATDDSDFIVIMGDTNDFGSTEETKTYWRTIEAGGFSPVLPYNIKTVTQDTPEGGTWWESRAIDQFFISDNITAIGYGIKNTKEDYALEDGYTSANTDNEQALSDHDFVYCDLKFNYDTPRTIVPVQNN